MHNFFPSITIATNFLLFYAYFHNSFITSYIVITLVLEDSFLALSVRNDPFTIVINYSGETISGGDLNKFKIKYDLRSE